MIIFTWKYYFKRNDNVVDNLHYSCSTTKNSRIIFHFLIVCEIFQLLVSRFPSCFESYGSSSFTHTHTQIYIYIYIYIYMTVCVCVCVKELIVTIHSPLLLSFSLRMTLLLTRAIRFNATNNNNNKNKNNNDNKWHLTRENVNASRKGKH